MLELTVLQKKESNEGRENSIRTPFFGMLMSTTLPSRYDPKEAETRWYPFWEDRGYFNADPPAGRDARKPYTIVIPPPNVTGALHMGHALNNTLQDILIRWRRAQGYNALWVPGTDHAGIATQAVVEKRIREQEGKTRRDLGRDELVRRIWAWKDDYERRILNQLRKLGCSCDWRRTRFTFDDGCSRAVRETFFKMFRDGLIYRGKRLVNWDTQLQTSVADDETYTEDVKGGFWTFKYPVKPIAGSAATSASPEFIRFSTTRPETMLGDTAIAVHPHDERYKHLIGRTVTVPLVGREIPIVADGILADPTLGTGCVKVTPAHDPNDYGCWQRKQGKADEIAIINILNDDGTINENGGPFAGVDRYAARERVTEEMEKLGLFDGREDRVIPLKFSDRSKTPIEPYLSDQWFVRMGPLAARSDVAPQREALPSRFAADGLAEVAMRAVRDGNVLIHPDRYAKTYLDWLGEKRDWCISRQLWWGHRIPVWTATGLTAVGAAKLRELESRFGDRMHVETVPPEKSGGGTQPTLMVCLASEAEGAAPILEQLGFQQDPDVLDTWFSSQLWPHSTLGWPEETPELKYFYPTSVLVTTRDIITLWVARMVIAGLYNRGTVPFHDVYITPKILDGFGQTMSKSKGNGVDPLDIIEKYGADALRFGIAYMTTDSQDARLPVGYECPFCETYIAQKIEHQQMKPKAQKADGPAPGDAAGRGTRLVKPRIKCPKCKKDFQFSSPNFDPDAGEPVARVVSERFEQGRNFANKLWNAARFVLMNLEEPGAAPAAGAEPRLADEDRWILSRLHDTITRVTEHLEAFRFSEVAKTLYDFAWSEFCAWYVEMAKLRLKDASTRSTAQGVLATVLDYLVRMLHPIMPFLSEQIWQALGEVAPTRTLAGIAKQASATPCAASVMIAAWPAGNPQWSNSAVESKMARLQDVVRAIRNIRSNFNVDEKARVSAFLRCSHEITAELTAAKPFIELLATVDSMTAGPQVTKPADSAAAVGTDWELFVPLTGLIDRDAEIDRNRKQLQSIDEQLRGYQSKLNNAEFVAKAPADVVELHRQRASELQAQRKSIDEILRELGGAA
jgi:valyl-tRNA synthetase